VSLNRYDLRTQSSKKVFLLRVASRVTSHRRETRFRARVAGCFSSEAGETVHAHDNSDFWRCRSTLINRPSDSSGAYLDGMPVIFSRVTRRGKSLQRARFTRVGHMCVAFSSFSISSSLLLLAISRYSSLSLSLFLSETAWTCASFGEHNVL